MKALQNLGKKIMNCVLVIALVLSTGISTVFAEGEITPAQLKESLDTLSSSVTALQSSSDGMMSSYVKEKIASIFSSNNFTENSITVSAISPSNGKIYKIVVTANDDGFTFDKDFSIESNEQEFINGAQVLTTTYTNLVSSLNTLVDKIKSVEEVTGKNVPSSKILNSLDKIKTDVASETEYKAKKYDIDNDIVSLVDIQGDLELYKNILDLNSQYEKEYISSLVTNMEEVLNGSGNKEEVESSYNNLVSSISLANELLGITDASNGRIEQIKSTLGTYDDNQKDIFNTVIENSVNGYVEPTNEDERTNSLSKLEILKSVLKSVLNENQTINDKIESYKKLMFTTLNSLTVHGFEFEKEAIDSGNKLSLYVDNSVTKVDIEFTLSDSNSRGEILGNENLKVGENEITIKVTDKYDNVKTYTVIVNRLEKYADLGDVDLSKNNTTTTNTSNSNVQVMNVEETIEDTAVLLENTESTAAKSSTESTDNTTKKDETKSNTSDSKDKYNEDLEEEKTNPLTIVLIIAGIALVGFGIYMLFGKDEDDEDDIKAEAPKKEEKVEIKKVEVKDNKKSTPKKKSSNNSKKRK